MESRALAGSFRLHPVLWPACGARGCGGVRYRAQASPCRARPDVHPPQADGAFVRRGYVSSAEMGSDKPATALGAVRSPWTRALLMG